MIKKLHSSRGRKLRYIKLLFTVEQLGLKDSMNAMALYKAAVKKARDTTIIKMCSKSISNVKLHFFLQNGVKMKME